MSYKDIHVLTFVPGETIAELWGTIIPDMGAPKYLKEEEQVKPLYLVIGAAAAGKDYFVDMACKWFEMTAVKSYTTRPKRSPEDDSHHFVESSWFKLHRDELVAYQKYAGYEYGALKEDVNKADFYIVDPKEAIRLRKELDRPCEIIFIDTSMEERFIRMVRRLSKSPTLADKAAVFDRLHEDYVNFKLRRLVDCADHIVYNDPEYSDDFKLMRNYSAFEEYLEFLAWQG